MHQRSGGTNFAGNFEAPSGLAGLMESTGVVRSDSMDVVNDPRFFQDNVINYRLAAFGGLSVVSGLLVQNCMDQLFEMDKNMQVWTQHHSIFHVNGILQLVAFLILIVILWMNMLATYVGVAQPYHTIRLMTAGPTGFDTAATYYLNRNIVTFRHMAIRCMLSSLPLYILQMALRLLVKFDRTTREAPSLPKDTPLESRIHGIVFCCIMAAFSAVLYWIHLKHFAIFRDRYQNMASAVTNQMQTYMQSMMTPKKSGLLDV
jgi:protein-S-isoprenylcysteine O-methyltransferase Ste14